jgi:cytochrome P450
MSGCRNSKPCRRVNCEYCKLLGVSDLEWHRSVAWTRYTREPELARGVLNLHRDVTNRDAALAQRDAEYDALTTERDRLLAERDELWAALRVARSELSIAASYVEARDISIGLRTHARACADAVKTIDAAIGAKP